MLTRSHKYKVSRQNYHREIYEVNKMFFYKDFKFQYFVYFQGFGSSVMMVTSLALTADFIGGNVESSGNKDIRKCFFSF
jgi:hypothetical protein